MNNRNIIIIFFYCVCSGGLIRFLWRNFVNVLPTVIQLYEWDDGPWLHWNYSSQTSITINWITKFPTSSRIRWGINPNALTLIEYSQLTKIHHVNLDNLTPSTQYYYQIISDTTLSKIDSTLHTFNTSPGKNQSFSFVLFGDTQNGGGWGDPQWGYPKLVDHVINSKMEYDLVMHVGDASDQGNDIKSWHQFISQSVRMAADHPMHIAVGNHDTGSNYLHDPTIKKTRDDGANFDYLFGFPFQAPISEQTLTSFRSRYYAFEYGCALCLFLDTQNQQLAAPWSPQWQFTEETLAKSKKTWKIVFVHWPMIEIKQENSLESPTKSSYVYRPIHYAKYFLPLFAKYGVQVIFTGHAHEFQHIEWTTNEFLPKSSESLTSPNLHSIHQIVSGGAGNDLRKNAPLLPQNINLTGFHIWEDSTHYCFVKVEENQIHIEARYPNGKSLYSTTITRYIPKNSEK